MQRPRTGGDRTAPRVALGASVASFVVVALVAATPASPFTPILPSEPGGPFRWLAELVGLDGVHGSALAAVGVVAVSFAAVAFLLVIRECRRGTISARAAIGLAIAYHLALLFLPLLFSRDVYSYAYYGKIAATYHANPYVATPADFPHDVLATFVGPKWVDTPAVYGALWTQVSALRDPRHRRRRHDRLDVPGDRDRREPRDRVRRGGPGPQGPSRTRGVRGRARRAEPGRAVPERGERAQRPAGRARGRGRPRARLLGARAVGDGRPRARDARSR